MKHTQILSGVGAFIILGLLTMAVPTMAATNVNLGTANSFAILAGTAITNIQTSVIKWDVGLSPAAGSNYTGLTTQQVGGTIYAADATGPASSIVNPGFLTTAKTDLVSAYDALSAGPNAACDITYAGTQDLVGLSLVPGVYCANTFELSGTLTLVGDENDVWIFRSASTLISSGTANIIGGNPCNIWWKVPSSATFGTDTSFKGTVIALTSISMNTRATLNGRALARNGAVTLDQNTINNDACAVASTVRSSLLTSSNGSGNTLPVTGTWNILLVATLFATSLTLLILKGRKTS